MSRNALPPSHYELKLHNKYNQTYVILPQESWRGVRTNVAIHCDKHQTKRFVWLQKIFNGRNSIWPCRQCFLDSLRPPY